MHCKLETIPGLEFLRCASDTPSSSDCNGDECRAVEFGWYKVEDNQAFISAALTPVIVFQVILPVEHTPVEEAAVLRLTAALPEFPKTWQFSRRTALPPRAPSIAS